MDTSTYRLVFVCLTFKAAEQDVFAWFERNLPFLVTPRKVQEFSDPRSNGNPESRRTGVVLEIAIARRDADQAVKDVRRALEGLERVAKIESISSPPTALTLHHSPVPREWEWWSDGVSYDV